VQLPPALRLAVDELAGTISGSELTRAANAISERYRVADFRTPPLNSNVERIAYTTVRMPATYAACRHVSSQLRLAAPTAVPKSFVDLGAGPGTAAWAAMQVFPSIEHVTLIERDVELIAMGERLAQAHPVLARAEWRQADLASISALPAADVVVVSYALGELARAVMDRLRQWVWEAATQFAVFIEPGTQRGFHTIAEVRQWLIGAGAKLAAPCPHENLCPMLPINDWCHFAARVERTSMHRLAKQGALGHEDEKFSYVIGRKVAVEQAETRIVRHPRQHGGFVQLELCTPDGLRNETVTRAQKDGYRAAKKVKWGDRWPPNT
jgi:ribosomal protein RSM22 (predicted rRNA methylase)